MSLVRERGREVGRKRERDLSHFPPVGIPTLIIVDDKGETITKNGRSAITVDPDGKVHAYYNIIVTHSY